MPRARPARCVILVTWLASLLVSGCVAGHALPGTAYPAPDAFYDPPAPLPPGSPGGLIRSAPLPAQPGARLWRILYRSTGLDGQPMAISGVAAVPDGPAPAGGFPLVTVAHGTAGMARHCAPSLHLLDRGPRSEQGLYPLMLKPLVEQGYAAVATDYQGLGAPGPASYGVGELEGRNVLDAARAARAMPELHLSSATLVWGHSQGGHAALFTGQLASTYAPELQILGVVAGAPAAELSEMLSVPGPIFEAPSRPSHFTAFILLVTAAWREAYADDRLLGILTPAGRQDLEPAERFCGLALLGAYAFRSVDHFVASDPATTMPWPDYLARNTPGSVPVPVPLLLIQGGADPLVHPLLTQQLVQQLCAIGDTVEYKEYSGQDHLNVIAAAIPDMLAWMAERLDRRPAVASCR